MTVSRRTFLAASLAFRGLPALAGDSERVHLVVRDRTLTMPDKASVHAGAVFDPKPVGAALRARRRVIVPLSIENGLREPIALHWRGLRAALATTGMTEMVLAPGEVAALDLVASDTGLLLLEARPINGSTLRRRALLPVLVLDNDPAPFPERTIVFAEGSDLAPDRPRFIANDQLELVIPVAVGVPLLLRCANGSAGHPFLLQVAGAPAALIGIDGQPTDSPTPWSATGEPFLPGTRSDLLLAGLPSPGAEAELLIDDGDGPRRIARVVASQPAPDGSPGVPRMPPPNPDLPLTLDLASATRADLPIGETIVPPLLTTKVGSTVVIRILNRTDAAAVVHLRGQTARLLHPLDDGWDPFWTDTFLVSAGAERLSAFVPTIAGEWRIETSNFGSDAPPAVTAITVI